MTRKVTQQEIINDKGSVFLKYLLSLQRHIYNFITCHNNTSWLGSQKGFKVLVSSLFGYSQFCNKLKVI